MTYCDQVLGLIPARAGSKGIPGKNIKPLGGIPLIGHTCLAAKASCIDQLMISTDCPQIAHIARQHGAEAPFLRPAELASDHAPTKDVIRHVLDHLLEQAGELPTTIVLLQPTSPFRTADDIDAALTLMHDRGSDSVVSVCEVPDHYNAHWQFEANGDCLQLATGEPLADIIPRRQQLPPTYIRNGAVYAFRTQVFLETGSFYGQSCHGHTMPAERSINLDTMDDWLAAERYLTTSRMTIGQGTATDTGRRHAA